MKKKIIFTVSLITIIIFSIAFYLTLNLNPSYQLFFAIWFLAVIIFRIVVTPIIVIGIFNLDSKKDQEQEDE